MKNRLFCLLVVLACALMVTGCGRDTQSSQQETNTISLELGRQGKNLHLSVYNTCPVMEREHLAHLFDRFYRTDQSRNSQTGGYGLGLSIARSIVLAHKGKIRAESADGNSLVITVNLPV